MLKLTWLEYQDFHETQDIDHIRRRNLTSFSSLKHDPIAATINLDRNKELYQTLKGDRAYFLATRVESNPTDTIINLERGQVFE